MMNKLTWGIIDTNINDDEEDDRSLLLLWEIKTLLLITDHL